ncbi:MAG TPA: DNA repair protein RadC [Vicinamibacterales bacterium]
MKRTKIADRRVDERPHERMIRAGALALSDCELLALLIEPGSVRRSALEIASELLADGLLAFARREWRPNGKVGSLDPSRIARIGAALELGRRIGMLSCPVSDPVDDPCGVAPRLVASYAFRVQEVFGGVYLDSRNRIVSEREIFVGTLSTASVSTRDVFRWALHDHAESVIVFHNHPSGDPAPSPQDLDFTSDLVIAGNALEVAVVDHLIVARSGFVSLRQRGLMPAPHSLYRAGSAGDDS